MNDVCPLLASIDNATAGDRERVKDGRPEPAKLGLLYPDFPELE